ncbi:plasmid pRiA4b ORF-3 family protein [Bacillus sp. 2205SS5-2]|uniref:plasmid pRiA4b ORF-3 family protein n=1 Tax=Bacillus sp. 2205SS5-2 TaxID=3109031 RepID=UPI003006B6A3
MLTKNFNDKNEIRITKEKPAYLVENFRIYLSYLKTHSIKLTKAKGYFTKKDLMSIQEQMKGVKGDVSPSATQIGYPIIHLFYHLSVVLDFIKVNRKQSSVIAMIQHQRIEEFKKLTDTEQFITLFETFWQEVDWQNLQGEKWKKAPTDIDFFFEVLESVPSNQEINLKEFPDIEKYTKTYGHFLYYFSYFGFWTFELDQGKDDYEGKANSTNALSIRLTPFFKEIQHILLETWEPSEHHSFMHSTHLLGSLLNLSDELSNELMSEEEKNIEPLSVQMSSLFPKGELFRTLTKKRPCFQRGSYLLKVKLSSSCWRIIRVSSSHTLLDVHNIIQLAFELDDDHLYSFFMDGKKFSQDCYNSPNDLQGPYVTDVKIGDLQLYDGKGFLYLFDFGDEWEFNVEVLKIAEGVEPDFVSIEEEFGAVPIQYGW